VNKTVQAADERKALADQMNLKGEERKSYILTGKLPGEGREPKQATELETWMSAFKRDNGRQPTADEIANRKSHTSSKADQIEKDKDTALQKAEAKAQERIDKLKIFDPTDPRPAPQRKQAIYADLEKQKEQIQKEYETRAAQNAGAVETGGTVLAAQARQPQRLIPRSYSLEPRLTLAGRCVP
jgi:hypothetical protein